MTTGTSAPSSATTTTAAATAAVVVALVVGTVLAGVALVRGPRAVEPVAAPPVAQGVPAPPTGTSAGRAVTSRSAARGVPAVDPAWIAATASAAGIPAPAVRAYAAATLRAGRDLPSCRLGWTTLAGIGWIESQHGTLGGRLVGEDGRSDRLILGVPLDGRGPVAAIPSTPDSVRWHGDPDWDRAIGPMQFIPSTWETWQSDGDGDRSADPHDLDDAAWAAARYLCASGADLTTGEGWEAAVLSYNRSGQYVADVRAAANAYAERTG